jgi:hypothetical protein
MLLLWSHSLQFIDDVQFCAALEGVSTLHWIKTELAKDGKLLGTNSEKASGVCSWCPSWQEAVLWLSSVIRHHSWSKTSVVLVAHSWLEAVAAVIRYQSLLVQNISHSHGHSRQRQETVVQFGGMIQKMKEKRQKQREGKNMY